MISRLRPTEELLEVDCVCVEAVRPRGVIPFWECVHQENVPVDDVTPVQAVITGLTELMKKIKKKRNGKKLWWGVFDANEGYCQENE